MNVAIVAANAQEALQMLRTLHAASSAAARSDLQVDDEPGGPIYMTDIRFPGMKVGDDALWLQLFATGLDGARLAAVARGAHVLLLVADARDQAALNDGAPWDRLRAGATIDPTKDVLAHVHLLATHADAPIVATTDEIAECTQLSFASVTTCPAGLHAAAAVAALKAVVKDIVTAHRGA